MSNPISVPGRHTQDPPAADLEDELARIASDVQSLAIRHGIDHAGSLTTDTLIRALHSIARNRPPDSRGDVPIVAVFAPKRFKLPETRENRHAREVAAVKASLMLEDTPEQRHGTYRRRAPRAA